jgi:hypothetical protein
VPDVARVLSLKEVLVNAAGGNVDREADVLTIAPVPRSNTSHGGGEPLCHGRPSWHSEVPVPQRK